VPTPRDPADRGSIDAATEWVLGGDPPAAVVDEYYEKYVTALAGATHLLAFTFLKFLFIYIFWCGEPPA